MRIYSFNELSEEQKRNVYLFITSFPFKGGFESYEEMAKLHGGVAFDHGCSYFSLWEDAKVIATLGVVSKEAEARGEIFLVSINIKEEEIDQLEMLLSRAFEYCGHINGAKYKLGIMYDRYYLIPNVKKSGFKEIYRNLVMQYNGGNVILQDETNKCFKTLCPENIKDYQKVENAAFLQAPNGSVIEDEELQGLLDEYCGTNMAGVFYEDDKPAGTYTLRIRNSVGWIEGIGVSPEYQGRGIGRKLLYKSVKVLQDAEAEKVKLSVFNTNTRALGLYVKSGFVLESEYSIWYEK